MTKQMMCILLGAALSCAPGTLAAGGAAAPEPDDQAQRSGKMYLPSADPVADLAAKLASAKAAGKRLLVVLGADWCHDSRALATRLFTAPLRTDIEAHYVSLFVDVGYLDQGKEVIASLGVPVYYATPTVLIIDPVSGQVVNAHDRHQWAEAANIGMQASIEYFRRYETTGQAIPAGENDTYLQVLLKQIAAFEQVQAERLYRAYAVIGPMLKAYKEGDRVAFDDALWNEVRDYRFRVPLDLEALRSEARERVAAGETGIELNYPVYPAFSWEPD